MEYLAKYLTYAWASAEIRKVVEEMKAAGDEVASMTFIAAKDAETCPLCKYLDEMTIGIGHPDAALFVPPLHDGCRCIVGYNSVDMRPDLRQENYKRPSRELIEEYLARQRLIRGA